MGPHALLHLAAGIGLALAAWVLPRRIAGCRRASPLASLPALLPALLLDMAPLGLGALLLAFATGRPLFAGLIILALGAGFALADYTMRQTLREPTVFSEMSELPQVFTHPHLYLPFAGPGLVLGGAAASIVAALALLALEPPLWTPHPVAGLAATAAIGLLGWLLAYQPLLGVTAGVLRRLAPTGEPFADAARLGPFGMVVVHAVIARAERQGRRQALGAPSVRRTESGRSAGGGGGGPIVLVQCESFFDARRLSPRLPRDLLAGYDSCLAGAAMFGRFGVPGWGANTMRTEFAVLSGIPESELGYDRFNPYYALARLPLESQIWRLRRAGYRTICLHPFDRRFFRRDLVMPALGFEQFLAREELGGARRPPYCPDPDLARRILQVLDREGPRTLIFAITMGNHGPWLPSGPPIDPAVRRMFAPDEFPGGGELLRYLDGLRRSDEMLRLLMEGLAGREAPSVLGFYGDHLPSLTGAFDHFGFDERDSDYAIWPSGGAPPTRRDLQAHDFGRLIVDAVLGEAPDETADCDAGPPPSARLGSCLALGQPASSTR